jgi:hypothetical protein
MASVAPINNPNSKLPSKFYFAVAGAVANLDFTSDAACVAAQCNTTREIWVGTSGDLVVTRPDGTDVTLKGVVGRLPPIQIVGVKAAGSTAQNVSYFF